MNAEDEASECSKSVQEESEETPTCSAPENSENLDKESKLSPKMSQLSAGVNSQRGDLNKRPQKRHFPEKNSSTIFTAMQPSENPANKEPLDYRKRKNLWW